MMMNPAESPEAINPVVSNVTVRILSLCSLRVVTREVAVEGAATLRSQILIDRSKEPLARMSGLDGSKDKQRTVDEWSVRVATKLNLFQIVFQTVFQILIFESKEPLANNRLLLL